MNIKNHFIKFIKNTTIRILPLLAISPYALATLSAEAQQEGAKGIILFKQAARTSAQPYLRVAAEAGDRQAQYYLGEAIRLGNLYMTAEARKWYESAAQQGDLYAMLRLSSKSDLCGIIGSCDGVSGEEWRKRVKKIARERADQGDAEAMSVLYVTGEGLAWLEKAAESGDADAQHSLAIAYKNHAGWFLIPGNRKTAITKWAKASAEAGHVPAMEFYANFLYDNQGDLTEVGYWLKRAAEEGHIESVSSYALYVAHLPKLFDYPFSMVEAYGLTYLVSQIKGGFSPRQARLGLPDLAAKMTPEEIQQAIAYAKEWEKTHPPLSYYPPIYGY